MRQIEIKISPELQFMKMFKLCQTLVLDLDLLYNQ